MTASNSSPGASGGMSGVGVAAPVPSVSAGESTVRGVAWFAGLSCDHLFADCVNRTGAEASLRRWGLWDLGGDGADPTDPALLCARCFDRYDRTATQ